VSVYEDELAQIVADLNRVAPGQRASQPHSAQSTATLDQLLVLASRHGASDLLLIADVPVSLRVNGALTPSAGPALTAEDTRSLLLPLLGTKHVQQLQQIKLPDRIPTLESLHLPPTLRRLEARQGLILITGPTGCGKSSTLAALVYLINAIRKPSPLF
jgi:twitching motility protein PilT